MSKRDDYPHDGPLASRRVKRTLTEPEGNGAESSRPRAAVQPPSDEVAPGSASVQNRHLFLATGQPTITPTQRALLRQAQKQLRNIDIARTLLTEAIRDDNPDKAATAIRSLTANSVFLTGYVNDAENDAA